ncbi:hypothetical protein P879_02202, partial [Paragonimus westermani]
IALQETSEVSSSLASLRRDFENKVDKHVCDPLTRLTDDVCASIGKQRRNLNKATNEARSAREQLQKAASQVTLAGAGSTVNLDWQTHATNQSSVAADALARLSQAQSQLDDKDRDVSLCKDNLIRDLYTFATQEHNYAMLLVEYLRLQEAHLEQSLQLVRQCIPGLVSTINKSRPLTTFHCHLPKHLAETGRTIAYVLEACISRLDNEATLQEEGLFRRSGSQRKTDVLVKALNLMQAHEQLLESCDSVTVASALKQYLQSLPEPLLTYSFAEQWATASKAPGSTNLTVVQNCLDAMPAEFRHNLAYLCTFLSRLASHSETNKMTTDNLSIMFAPSLYRLLAVNANPGLEHALGERKPVDGLEHSLDFLACNGPGICLIDLLIRNADTLFEKDKPFLPTGRTSSPTETLQTGHSRSASFGSLTDSKPLKPAESYRIHCEHLDNGKLMEGNGSQTEATNLAPSKSRKPSHTSTTLLRKKTLAPKPPVQRPHGSTAVSPISETAQSQSSIKPCMTPVDYRPTLTTELNELVVTCPSPGRTTPVGQSDPSIEQSDGGGSAEGQSMKDCPKRPPRPPPGYTK